MTDTGTQTYRRMVRAVAQEADTDQFYERSRELGTLAWQALSEKKRSQMTGLETLANSTQRVTDIFDYIKLRVARQSEWRMHNFGPELLTHLESTLRERRDFICEQSGISNLLAADEYERQRQQQQIYLLLIRTFIAQLVAQYEYANQTQEGNSGGEE